MSFLSSFTLAWGMAHIQLPSGIHLAQSKDNPKESFVRPDLLQLQGLQTPGAPRGRRGNKSRWSAVIDNADQKPRCGEGNEIKELGAGG